MLDLNQLLLFLVVLNSILTLINALNNRHQHWIIVSVGILILTGCLWLLLPDYVGYLAFISYAIWGLLPSWLYRRMEHYYRHQQYDRVLPLIDIVRWLHPFPFFHRKEQKQFTLASLYIQQNRDDEAIVILERLAVGKGYHLEAQLRLHTLYGDYESALAFLEKQPRTPSGRIQPNYVPVYVRALGETGKVNEMLAVLEEYDLLKSQIAGYAPVIFGFAGRVDSIHKYHAKSNFYSPEIGQLWLATAEITAGNREAGVQHLEGLPDSYNALIERRKTFPLPLASDVLTSESQKILIEASQQLDNWLHFSPQPQQQRRTYATWGLILINCIVFGIELQRNVSKDFFVLLEMGAIIGNVVEPAEWWRFIAYMFLHANIVHLLFNMLALFILGQRVERHLGHLRYLALYLITGILAGIVVVMLPLEYAGRPFILVGASAAILGLLGATASMMLRGWLLRGAVQAQQQLMYVAINIGILFFLKVAFPETSLTAHIAGVVIGFILIELIQWLFPMKGKMIQTEA